MSIPVEVEALSETVARYGPETFLLTTGADGRPHATHVVVEIDGAILRCGIGRRTARNATEQPLVSFLWPPAEPGGYSLIVDGEIVIERADEERVGAITATKAVLHRPAVNALTREPANGSDCVRVAAPGTGSVES